jgi:hypothetical protein
MFDSMFNEKGGPSTSFTVCFTGFCVVFALIFLCYVPRLNMKFFGDPQGFFHKWEVQHNNAPAQPPVGN